MQIEQSWNHRRARKVFSRLSAAVLGCVLVAAAAVPARGQGVMLRSVGSINESMAGAATACPLDAVGAIRYNPASISGLAGNEMSFSMTLILPDSELGSQIGPFSGWSDSEPGVIAAPSMAFVRQIEDSSWSYGLGMYGIGGSAVNYPAASLRTNPILSPQAPYGVGLGRLSANVELYQIAPVLSYEVDEHLSIGFGPTVTLGKLYCSPLFLGPLYTDSLTGASAYSSGVGTRNMWGGGFQVGAYYTTDADWHFGTSVTSPQWLERIRYKSEDAHGNPESVTFAFDLPLQASVGAAYSGFEKWVLAADVRYIDYANTTGFKESGYNADGSVKGLGWENVWALCLGAQRQLNDRLFVRGGYQLNSNPITSESVIYNVASPLIVKHSLHLGLSYIFADNWMASLACIHCFEADATGPISTPAGTVPNSWVSTTGQADTASLEITKRF
jgi:long-chain fatty acid transport protein